MRRSPAREESERRVDMRTRHVRGTCACICKYMYVRAARPGRSTLIACLVKLCADAQPASDGQLARSACCEHPPPSPSV